jgi:DNA (cytosine-5)-methyltransferase 1
MEFVRFGRLLSPEVMVMENVPNLLKVHLAGGNPVICVIEDTLRQLGYFVSSGVLNAAEFGVPQARHRLFVIASKKKLSKPFPAPTHYISACPNADLFGRELNRCPTLWDAISDLPPLSAGEGAEEMNYRGSVHNGYQRALRENQRILYNHKAMSHTPRMVERFASMKWGDSVNDVPAHLKPRRRNSQELATKAYDQNNRRLRPHTQCHTIPASFYANFVHPFQHRNFTAREGARIQSFPDAYRFLGKPTVVSHKLLAREGRHDERHLCQFNQIGNAVPPLLAKALAVHLAEQLGWPHVRTRR